MSNFQSVLRFARNSLVVLSFCSVFSHAASAATVNRINLVAATCGPVQQSLESSVERLEENINGGGTDCTYTVDGHAGAGMVGVRTTHNKTGGPGLEQTAATASLEADFSITAPNGFAGLVPISVNLALDGLVTADRSTLSLGVVSGLRAFASITQDSRTFGRASEELEASTGSLTASDEQSIFDRFDGVLSTSEILVDPTLPLILRLRLEGITTLAGTSEGSFSATGFVDAFNTLSLATSGPAFNLPDGFSVTSTALNVFDNQWIDARVQNPGVSEVPLPATVLLLATALGILRSTRRG